MFRLYVDEVGFDEPADLEDDKQRFLSLTGVAMRTTSARDDLTPKFDWIKTTVFDHDPDEPVIFHRKKIVARKGDFGCLRDPEKCALFDKAIIRAMKVCDYRVITVVIDMLEASKREKWREKHPYHYLMKILVEKYARFLERQESFGDIMPEGRKGPKDARLQEAFEEVRQEGVFYYSPEQIRYRIPGSKLKFRYKSDNIAGLQLADLLAHPSHMHIRKSEGHDVEPGTFALKVRDILVGSKYDRSHNGTIRGYGMKYLP